MEAVAIYFYDVTHHLESLKLENQVKDYKQQHEKIVNSQLILSHEFRAPLSSSLMFLESLIHDTTLSQQARDILMIIIQITNLLISFVNDTLDI